MIDCRDISEGTILGIAHMSYYR